MGRNDGEIEKVMEEGALVNGCGRRMRNLHELMRTSLFEHRPFTVGTRSVRTQAIYRRDTISSNTGLYRRDTISSNTDLYHWDAISSNTGLYRRDAISSKEDGNAEG